VISHPEDVGTSPAAILSGIVGEPGVLASVIRAALSDLTGGTSLAYSVTADGVKRVGIAAAFVHVNVIRILVIAATWHNSRD